MVSYQGIYTLVGLQLGFRDLSNFSSASPRFAPAAVGRRCRGSSSLANLPCSGLSFESIRCREVRQPSADQPQPVISNDQTPFFSAKYKMDAFFLLDDRLAKFTSPTICINMIIGSFTTLLEGVTIPTQSCKLANRPPQSSLSSSDDVD